MANPMLPMKGSCLCGAVQVKVTKPALLTVACHCRDCQKLTASAFSMTTMFPSDGIWVTGDVIQGGLRSDERKHSYCRSCLGFVYSRIKGADHRVNLRTSLLGDAAGFEPFVEVMTDQKLPWVQLPVVHSFAQAPKSREELQALMDAYAGRSDV